MRPIRVALEAAFFLTAAAALFDFGYRRPGDRAARRGAGSTHRALDERGRPMSLGISSSLSRWVAAGGHRQQRQN